MFRIEAGWVYAEPGLAEQEVVRDPENNEYTIVIPPEIRQITTFATISHSEETVEFVKKS